MRAKRVLVAVSEAPSNWESCRQISANLKKAYAALVPSFDIQFLNIPRILHEWNYDKFEQISALVHVCEFIQQQDVDRIVFLDQVPQAADLMCAFRRIVPEWEMPPVSLHLYGDFTLFADKWVRFGQDFKGHRVQLLCASQKQSNLVRNFLPPASQLSEGGCVYTVPFPVDGSGFHWRMESRSRRRSIWSVDSQDRIILYAGRLSLQKNIVRLIDEFARLESSEISRSWLFFAGAFDDVGAGRFGAATSLGYHFQRVHAHLATLPSTVSKRIRFLGHLNQVELAEAYCAADLFVSLSNYHDEDFGMAVAEALSCGLPSLVTDWAGYSAFEAPFAERGACRPCRLVPLNLDESGIMISSEAIQQELRSLLNLEVSEQDRLEISAGFSEVFSIESVARKLAEALELHPEPFSGFDWALDSLASRLRERSDSLFPLGKEGLYSRVYSAYFTEGKGQDVEWNRQRDLVNWTTDYLAFGGRKATALSKSEAVGLKECFWPFCETYHSPAQPIFLFDGWEKSLILAGQRWQARDGLVPLFWFFTQVKPDLFPAQLMIHEDFRPLVPAEWRKHVGYYRIESRIKPVDWSLAKRIIIGGLLCPPFIDQSELEEEIDQLVETVGKERLKSLEILAYLPFRSTSYFWNDRHQDVPLSMPLALAKKLGTDIQPVTWNQLETNRSQLAGQIYHEINRGWIVKDTTLQHIMLSSGALSLESLRPHTGSIAEPPAEQVIPLSPYHQMVISDPDANNHSKEPSWYEEQRMLQYARIGNYIFKDKRFNHLWPEWFEALCKAAVSGSIAYEPKTERSYF